MASSDVYASAPATPGSPRRSRQPSRATEHSPADLLAALADAQAELAAERAARAEAEAVLADTTTARCESSLHPLHRSLARRPSPRCASRLRARPRPPPLACWPAAWRRCALRGLAGPSLTRSQHAAAEAVALLREQLRVREAELATLRAARPGVCARCAEVALALAVHPAFRPLQPLAPEGRLHARLAALAFLPHTLALLALAASAWGALLGWAAAPLLLPAASAALALPPSLHLATPARRACRASLLLLFWLASGCAALLAAARSPSRAAALLAYVFWAAAVDGAPQRGARCWEALRRRRLWGALAEAAQVSLRKTGELESGAKHVLAYAPAGPHVSAACLLAFACPAACGWDESYPGLPVRLALPPASPALQLPLLREALLALGLVDGSDAGLAGVLGRGGALADGGVLVAPMPLGGGGGQEAEAAAARRRLARAALRAGASLVPAFGLGDASGAAMARREAALREAGALPFGSAARAAARAALGIEPPLARAFLAPAVGAARRGMLARLPPGSPAAALVERLAALLAPAPAPAARPAGLAAAAAVAAGAAVGDSPRVRIVVGSPIEVQRTERPSEEAVEELAARLLREVTALASAHAAMDEGAGD